MTATTFLPQSIYVGSAGLVGANAAGLCKVLTAEEAKPLVDLSAYLPLAGGTMTGQLGLNGHAKLGGVSAGVAAIYANDGVTLGTLQASTLSNPNGNLDFNCNSSDYRFYNGSNWIVIDPGNGSIDLRANNGTKQSAYFNKDGQINIGGGFQNTDGIRLTSLTGIVAVKQADGTTLGTLQARTIESSGTLTLKQSGTEAINFITGQAYIYSLLRPSVDNLYDCGVAAQRWRTGYFGTSVITPLVDNPTATLTLGNATYGVTVPGNAYVTGRVGIGTYGWRVSSNRMTYTDSATGLNTYVTINTSGVIKTQLDGSFEWATSSNASSGIAASLKFNGTNIVSLADGGLKIRNLADTANAPITAGAATFSGTVARGNSTITNENFSWFTGNSQGTSLGTPSNYGVQIGSLAHYNAGNTDRSTPDCKLNRNATGPQWRMQANGGLQIRNLADSADASITAGAATFSGTVNTRASTTAASTAPIKIATGVLMTTPEAGAIEYDGTNLYFTDSGGTRRQLAVV